MTLLTFASKTASRHPNPLPLQRHNVLRLGDAHGLRLSSLAGTLWITLDGDPIDYVLEPGESLRVDSHAPAVVSALHAPACLTVQH